MEKLALYEEWLSNEKKIAELLLTLQPLLENRHQMEEKDPRLGLLRDDRVAPGEAPPPKTSADLLGVRPTTMMLGSGEPLRGDPHRPVPTMEDFQRLVEKKRAKNKKTHDRQKRKKAVEKSAEPPPSE